VGCLLQPVLQRTLSKKLIQLDSNNASIRLIFYQVQYPVNVVINLVIFLKKNAELLWLNVPDEQYLKNFQL